MSQRTQNQNSQALHAAGGIALAVIWVLFAYRHVTVFVHTGEWPYLVFCLSETLQAGLFIIRYQPVSISNHPLDWIVAITGTVAPLFFVPGETNFGSYAGALIIIGTLLQILGLASLNRSFAIVAAKRKIRTRGMYRIVRHPIYASYLVILSGYVWVNATTWNISLISLTVACIAARIVSEERHLCVDSTYRQYATQVRYRLVPFVF